MNAILPWMLGLGILGTVAGYIFFHFSFQSPEPKTQTQRLLYFLLL